MTPEDEDHSESSQRKQDECIDEDKLEDETKENVDPNIFDKPFKSIQPRESVGNIEVCSS